LEAFQAHYSRQNWSRLTSFFCSFFLSLSSILPTHYHSQWSCRFFHLDETFRLVYLMYIADLHLHLFRLQRLGPSTIYSFTLLLHSCSCTVTPLPVINRNNKKLLDLVLSHIALSSFAELYCELAIDGELQASTSSSLYLLWYRTTDNFLITDGRFYPQGIYCTTANAFLGSCTFNQ
jgi:hypothetical protein